MGIRLAVQITANAKKTEVLGVRDGALNIKLHMELIEGKANLALTCYFAETPSTKRRGNIDVRT